MPIIVGTAYDALSVDFPSVLDDAMRRIVGRLETLGREQKELEMSLMSLKELRANMGHLPEAATRAILAAMRQQATPSGPRRGQVMETVWGSVVTDDEDGPACAEPLSAAESLTNYEKIVQFFLRGRTNRPRTRISERPSARPAAPWRKSSTPVKRTNSSGQVRDRRAKWPGNSAMPSIARKRRDGRRSCSKMRRRRRRRPRLQHVARLLLA